MDLMLENRVDLIRGATRFVIAPRPPADLIAVAKLDVKPGRLRENVVVVPGADGTQRTVLGYEDAEIEVTLQIWEESQLSALAKLSELFRPKRASTVHEPLEIVARPAQRWGIRHVYLVEIHERPWDPRSGLVVELRLREWQPTEKRKTTKPKPVAPKGAPGGKGVGGKGGQTEDWSFLEGRDVAAPPSKRGVPKP